MTCIEAKRAAMKRADGRCEGCGEELRRGHYHFHHVTYERKHHEDPDDLRVLCLSCHGEEHPHHDFVSPEEARRRGGAREGRRLSCRTRWPQGKKQIKGWRDGEWPVQCARCRMLVVHEKALRQHTKAVHPGEEPLSVQELESA